jgi:hypothetical protein
MKHKLGIMIILLVIVFSSVVCGFGQEAAEEAEPAEATGKTLVDLNMRQGPGVNYDVVGSLPADSEFKAVGRNADSSWLAVEDKDGNQVWVSAASEFVEIDADKVAALSVVEASASAYDAGDPNVNKLFNEIPLVLHNPNSFTCVSHAGLKNLEPLTEGNVIGPHSGDFVHTELGNVLFKYINGSLRLIRENPIARFEGDAESLSFEEAIKMFELGEIVWTGHIGEWPARGVTGCDPAAKQ